MNQLWVRISLTYVGIVVFLILIPSLIFLTIHAEDINPAYAPGNGALTEAAADRAPARILERFLGLPRVEILAGIMRILFSISLVGILVGVISSRGLAAPLNNLAKAAQAIGSQDLSQRIEVKGSSEVREVALAFNAMAGALEEAETLRSNLLADIAHELRTPLTVIQGNLRAILDDVYQLDKVEVARLYDQTRQLSRLVDDLHDLALLEARQFSLNISRQDLALIIKDIAAIYQPLFEDQGIELVLDLPGSIPAVQADPARLAQCINNLLNNALRHTPQGGEIQVRIEEGPGQVVIIVQDNGAGIDAEHLPHVFDRFYRVDPDRSRKTGGSGLGLAITRALVEAHGGTISAASQGKGQGSLFRLSLPISASAG